MKKLLASLAAMTAITAASASTPPAIPADPAIEKLVKEKVATMTIDEKVGQMMEIVSDLLGHFEGSNFVLDQDKLDYYIGKYKVGSVLNAPGTVAQTPEKWNEIISKIQEVSMKEIGIPCIYGLDQNHGTTYTDGGTLQPQNLNMAATFNRALVTRGGQITAYETRASDCPWTYSPTIDLDRDQRWPRFWENFGEDPYLTGQMAIASVKGLQGEDPNHVGKNNIAVSLKHYMGYSVPFTGKDRTPAYISLADLREKHFQPFVDGIRAGALTVMVNSASVNGLPVHANKELLTGWLKEDLNWDGMIVTDWADINNLYTREKIAADKKEALEIGINAGIDMIMEPYAVDACDLLKELVAEGRVPMSRIDDAVSRVLRLKYRLGLFKTPDTTLKEHPDFACAQFAADATQAAQESMVLLKNDDDVLPLKEGQKLLVTGPNANSMRCLLGGWSYTWQGHLANNFTEQYNTILEALNNRFGAANIVYEPGVTYNETGAYWAENEPEIEKAVAAAANVDVIVACVGENSYCETPGNLTDMTLSRNQLELVKALAKTGKPIVLILNEGRPRLVAEIEPLSKAVVDVMLPGNYGGDALASLLSGDANFSGKLPFTYPKEINSLSTYDYKPSQEVETMAGAYDYNAVVSAQWAFGYGRSYTTFGYANLRVDRDHFRSGDTLTFTVDVTNTGDVAGKEAVLLFSKDLIASLPPDNRRLRAFEKIELRPGETKTVELKVAADDLAFVNYQGHWTLERGDFRVQVGDQVVGIVCDETRVWDSPVK